MRKKSLAQYVTEIRNELMSKTCKKQRAWDVDSAARNRLSKRKPKCWILRKLAQSMIVSFPFTKG